MLILPVTDVNFQAYADNIAGDFFGKGISLADGIVKIARENEFTPEEVKRLVEKTNTAASLHLLKTAKDRKATFSLANLEQVLQQVFPAGDEPLAKAASVYNGIPETGQTRAGMAKAASMADNPVAQEKKDIDGFRALLTINQELDGRWREKIARECSLQKQINSLCQRFIKRDAAQFQKFAADCVALYGDKCRPVLDGIAGYLRVGLVKTPSEGIIDDTAHEFGIMKEICSGLETLVKLGAEIGHLEKIGDGVWEGAKRCALP